WSIISLPYKKILNYATFLFPKGFLILLVGSSTFMNLKDSIHNDKLIPNSQKDSKLSKEKFKRRLEEALLNINTNTNQNKYWSY
ncbi:hypothetical protein H5410_046880, partial [Solanum commersonii]